MIKSMFMLVIKTPITAILLVFCLSLSQDVSAEAIRLSELDKSVVRIIVVKVKDGQGGIGLGSGFVLNQEGYVVTNHHVVADGKKFIIADGADRSKWLERTVELKWSSAEKDLALLKVKNLHRTAVVLAEHAPEKASRVLAIGFPGVADALSGGIESASWVEPSISEGILSRDPFEASWGAAADVTFPVIQHTAAINQGNSGGPVFDACGRVIGINTAVPLNAGAAQGVTVSGVYFASHVSNLLEVLRSRKISFTSNAEPCQLIPPANNTPATSTSSPPPTTPTIPPNGIPIQPASQTPSNHVTDGFVIIWILFALLLAAIAGLLFMGQKTRHLLSASLRHWWQGNKKDQEPKPPPVIDNQPEPMSDSSWQLSGQNVQIMLSEKMLRDNDKGIVLGRLGQFCDYTIDHETVSQRHVRILWHEGKIYVEDLNSTNGTSVHADTIEVGKPAPGCVSRPFKPILLPDGATLVLGQVRLLFRKKK